MDIDAEDCRLEGCRDNQAAFWTRATHIPTGVVVELPGGGAIGLAGKRLLMEKLQRAVNEAQITSVS